MKILAIMAVVGMTARAEHNVTVYKYSQMKLAMKREALRKLNRQASEEGRRFDTGGRTGGVLIQF